VLRHLGQNVDQVVVGYLFGARQLGFYDSAYRWSIAASQQIYTPLQNVAVSGLSRLQHDTATFRRATRRALLPVFSVIMPVLACLAVQARPTIVLLLGSQWEASVPLFRMLCIAAMGNAIARGVNWLYLAEGRTRQQMRWGFVSLPVVIAAVLVGATRGALGVATGFATAHWLLAIPEVLYCLRESRVTVRDYFGAVGRPLVAAVVAALAVALVPGEASEEVSLATLLVTSVAYGIIYIVTWLLIPGGRGAAGDLNALWRASRAQPPVSS
jgi:PST family polysaccharide transporter